MTIGNQTYEYFDAIKSMPNYQTRSTLISYLTRGSGQVKVSNLIPETRSPSWMGSGEGRGGIVGLGQAERER